jgi:hypothetical protein
MTRQNTVYFITALVVMLSTNVLAQKLSTTKSIGGVASIEIRNFYGVMSGLSSPNPDRDTVWSFTGNAGNVYFNRYYKHYDTSYTWRSDSSVSVVSHAYDCLDQYCAYPFVTNIEIRIDFNPSLSFVKRVSYGRTVHSEAPYSYGDESENVILTGPFSYELGDGLSIVLDAAASKLAEPPSFGYYSEWHNSMNPNVSRTSKYFKNPLVPNDSSRIAFSIAGGPFPKKIERISSRGQAIYPNPANDHTSISIPSTILHNTELTLTDMLGNILLRRTVSGGDVVPISLAGLPRGVMMVRCGEERMKMMHQ